MVKGRLSFILVLVLVCLFFQSTQAKSNLKLKLKDSVIETNRQWSRVKIGVEAQKYAKIIYDQRPKDWKQVLDYIYIPKEYLNEDRKYPCKVRVRDNKGEQLKRTVVFVVSNRKVQVSDVDYDYDHQFPNQFYNTGSFAGKPTFQVIRDRQLVREKQEEQIRKASEVKKQKIEEQINRISQTPGFGISKLIEGLISQEKEGEKKLSLTSLLKTIQAREAGFADSKFNWGSSYQQKQQTNLYQDRAPTIRQIFQQAQNIQKAQEIQKEKQIKKPKISIPTSTSTKESQKSSFQMREAERVQFQRNADLISRTNQNIISNRPTTTTSSSTSSQIRSNTPSPIQQTINTANIQSSTDNPTERQQQIISRATVEATQTTQSRSIESIFLRLPSYLELDEIILAADSFAILKTVQSVIRSDLTCEQKISYLTDFFGRIQSAIQMKSFAAEQLRVIIASAREQIQSLKKNINLKKDQIQALGLNKLRDFLQEELIKLQLAYNEFNTVDSQIEPKQALILGFERDTQIINAKSDQDRAAIVKNKLDLTGVDNQISTLERQLRDAKSRKASIESAIKKLENNLIQYSRGIESNNLRIKQLQKQIDILEQQSDALKIKYSTLQITVERARTDVSKAQSKQDVLFTDIKVLEEKVSIEEKKLATRALEKLDNMINDLRTSQPGLEERIDTLNFECFSVQQVQARQENNIVVYYIGAKSFSQYIKESYHLSNTGSILGNSLSSQIGLTPSSILSKPWLSTFGNPYDASVISKSTDFSFEDDFNCLAPSSLQTGNGVIKKIESKRIIADVNGSSVILNLSACSRIESTQSLPSVGQKIIWRGNPLNNSSFNIYRASCI